jgi:hypothetical protein
MSVETVAAKDIGQDESLGRLVVTRIADPGGRWQQTRDVHEALLARGVKVLMVEWGDAGNGNEVVVTADKAVTDLLTALPVPANSRAALMARIEAATTVNALKTLLIELLPRVRLDGDR